MPARIERLSVTPVKGTHLLHPKGVVLDAGGASEDRLFHLIDERSRMINGKHLGELSTIRANYDGELGVLRLAFPDGLEVSSEVELGEELSTRFYSRPASVRLVLGPFSQALSRHLRQEVRLVQTERASGSVDRGKGGGVSIISRASVARLAQEAGEPEIDERRFRMLIEISGVEANEEDEWVGRQVAIGGSARVAIGGHVGRCLVTSRDPDTGRQDLPTLELLAGYRREEPTTEPLALGVYGEVLEGGAIHVGDKLTVSS